MPPKEKRSVKWDLPAENAQNNNNNNISFGRGGGEDVDPDDEQLFDGFSGQQHRQPQRGGRAGGFRGRGRGGRKSGNDNSASDDDDEDEEEDEGQTTGDILLMDEGEGDEKAKEKLTRQELENALFQDMQMLRSKEEHQKQQQQQKKKKIVDMDDPFDTNPSSLGEEGEEDEEEQEESATAAAITTAAAAASISSFTCESCKSNPAKYRCPRCGVHSCGLACVRAHKAESGCSGVADAGRFVPLQHFSTEQLRRDLRFVTDCQRVLTNSQRGLEKVWRYSFRALPPPLHQLRQTAKSRGIICQITSEGMSRRTQNTSRYDRNGNAIVWHAEFKFVTTNFGADNIDSAAASSSSSSSSPLSTNTMAVSTRWAHERFLLRDVVLSCWAENPKLPKYPLAKKLLGKPNLTPEALASLSTPGGWRGGRGSFGRGWQRGGRMSASAGGATTASSSVASRRYVAPIVLREQSVKEEPAEKPKDGGGGDNDDDAADKKGGEEDNESLDLPSSSASSRGGGGGGGGVTEPDAQNPQSEAEQKKQQQLQSKPTHDPFIPRPLFWSRFEEQEVADAAAKSRIVSLLAISAKEKEVPNFLVLHQQQHQPAAAASSSSSAAAQVLGDEMDDDNLVMDFGGGGVSSSNNIVVEEEQKRSSLEQDEDNKAVEDDDDAPKEKSARSRPVGGGGGALAKAVLDHDDDDAPTTTALCVTHRPFAVFIQLERCYGGDARTERRYIRINPDDTVCNALRKIFFVNEFPTFWVVPLPPSSSSSPAATTASSSSSSSEQGSDEPQLPPLPSWVSEMFVEATADQIREMRATFRSNHSKQQQERREHMAEEQQPGGGGGGDGEGTTTNQDDDAAAGDGTVGGPVAQQPPQESRPQRDMSRVPCRNFLKGRCHAFIRGEECPFWHCSAEEVPLCHKMLREGACPHGERCSFSHDSSKLRARWAETGMTPQQFQQPGQQQQSNPYGNNNNNFRGGGGRGFSGDRGRGGFNSYRGADGGRGGGGERRQRE